MQQVTFYDSMYEENKALKPTTHMTCKLSLHDVSKELLSERGILEKNTKLTPMICVLEELPQVNFTTKWEESTATSFFTAAHKLFTSTNNMLSIGNLTQMLANDEYVSTPLTNEFSQKVMTASSPLSLTLKFRIYADSYNSRYRQMTSTYETWLKTLFFATSPLVTSTFGNYANNISVAIDKGTDHIFDMASPAKEAVCAIPDLVSDLIQQKYTKETEENINMLITNLKLIVDKASDLVTMNNAFGHIVFDIEIPKFIKSTKNSNNKVYWYISTFNATPSPQFVRGLYDGKSELFRPKPLYYDFSVTLNTAQDLTREQMITLFVPNNMINRVKVET